MSMQDMEDAIRRGIEKNVEIYERLCPANLTMDGTPSALSVVTRGPHHWQRIPLDRASLEYVWLLHRRSDPQEPFVPYECVYCHSVSVKELYGTGQDA